MEDFEYQAKEFLFVFYLIQGSVESVGVGIVIKANLYEDLGLRMAVL